MKKLKVCMWILIILIIILGIYIVNIQKDKYPLYTTDESTVKIEEGGTLDVSKEEEVTLVSNPTMYYTIVKCINTHLHDISTAAPEGISMIEQEEIAMTEGEKANRIYNELSIEYIEENNITISNVREYVYSAENYLSFYPISMNVLKSKSNQMISNYGVYGRLRDYGTDKFIGYTYIIVTIDLNNMTYAIKPLISEEISSLEELNLTTTVTSVEKNENNTFSYEVVNDETLVKKYINTYKMYALYYPDIAYEYLDEEYRNARFGNLEIFQQYVNENKDAILRITLDKYQKTQKDGYTQYVCLDTNGNYYIFRETATMQFTLLLDTYTVDIPEFTNKYNQADNETKMGMNIEKIVAALNAKDYHYLYGKLDSGFKNNYFQSEDALKQYLQTNFFEKNTVEYDSVDNAGKNYMFDIKIKNASDSTKQVSKRMIMQFKEGTDFVFSFNV